VLLVEVGPAGMPGAVAILMIMLMVEEEGVVAGGFRSQWMLARRWPSLLASLEWEERALLETLQESLMGPQALELGRAMGSSPASIVSISGAEEEELTLLGVEELEDQTMPISFRRL